MATQTGKKKSASTAKAVPVASGVEAERDRIVDAALRVAAGDGWRDLTLAAVAREAGLRLADVYRHFRARHRILTAYGERIDLRMLEECAAADGEALSAHDRLFDAVIAQFEAMDGERDALRVIWHDLLRDPAEAARLLPAAVRSAHWTLEAAGVPAGGIAGALRARALAGIIAQSFRVWLEDEGPDLARTMADLDRRLRRAERFVLPRSLRGLAAHGMREMPEEQTPAN